MKLAALALGVFLAASQAQRSDALRIYVIDVEGGGSTLVVSPGGQSMLIDSGSPGAAAERDSKRGEQRGQQRTGENGGDEPDAHLGLGRAASSRGSVTLTSPSAACL